MDNAEDVWEETTKGSTTFGSVVRFDGKVYLYLQGKLASLSNGLNLPLSDFSDAPKYWEVLQVETEDDESPNSLIYVIQKHLNI